MEVLGVAWGLVAPDSSPHTHVPRGEDLHLSDSFGRDHGCGQAPAYQGKEYKEMVAGLGWAVTQFGGIPPEQLIVCPW